MRCNLCPRNCNVDRRLEKGYCGMSEDIYVARASKHFWEEPPISGTNGSGTVFFSGCNLGCVYCQNFEISHDRKGKVVSKAQLCEIFHRLTESGVHNINLVNPTHYALKIKEVLEKAALPVPVVYNSSGYEKVSTLRSLEGLVDIYLPDFKYIDPVRSEKYSAAGDYSDIVCQALIEMKRQCPKDIFDENGIMQKGVIIRHLVLPQNTKQSIKILEWIKENIGTDTYISLMSQYTPCGKIEAFPELQRRITAREYDKVVDAAFELGFENVFVQDGTAASESFIPDFDFSGV